MSETNKPEVEVEVVRQLTLVQAVTGLLRLTGNVNHFSKDPADIEAIHKTLREITTWWPGYAGMVAEVRINLLLAGQVIKDNFPNIMAGFPGLGERATETLKRVLVQLEGMDSNGNIPEAMVGTYITQDFWLGIIAKTEAHNNTWREMYNLDVERKKNPGKVLVGNQWLEYGSVFLDDRQTEMVAINHQIVPKETLETRAQGMENILAVMSPQFAQPAIDLINELGGNMFAACCRGGVALIHHQVNACYEASVADLKPELAGYLTKERPDHPMDELLMEPAFDSTGWVPVGAHVKLEDLTDEELETLLHGKPAIKSGETLREAVADSLKCLHGHLEWFARAKPDVLAAVRAGTLQVRDIAGAHLLSVIRTPVGEETVDQAPKSEASDEASQPS